MRIIGFCPGPTLFTLASVCFFFEDCVKRKFSIAYNTVLEEAEAGVRNGAIFRSVLAHHGAIVIGEVAVALSMFVFEHGRPHRSWTVDNIHVVCPAHTHDAFIRDLQQRCTIPIPFSPVLDDDATFGGTVATTYGLNVPGSDKTKTFTVIRTPWDNPLGEISSPYSTADYVAVTASRLITVFPHLSMHRRGFVGPEGDMHQGPCHWFRKRGWTILPPWRQTHYRGRCGIDPSCPRTLRWVGDRSTFWYRLDDNGDGVPRPDPGGTTFAFRRGGRCRHGWPRFEFSCHLARVTENGLYVDVITDPSEMLLHYFEPLNFM